MTDFVLDLANDKTKNTELFIGSLKINKQIFNYAKFLKQPLTLGQFIPCDLDRNILVEPKEFDSYCKGENCNCGNDVDFERPCSFIEYNEAKERVLFKGFEIIKSRDHDDEYDEFDVAHIFNKGLHNWKNITSKKTIEDLITKPYHTHRPAPKNGYILTESALKQIGL